LNYNQVLYLEGCRGVNSKEYVQSRTDSLPQHAHRHAGRPRRGHGGARQDDGQDQTKDGTIVWQLNILKATVQGVRVLMTSGPEGRSIFATVQSEQGRDAGTSNA